MPLVFFVFVFELENTGTQNARPRLLLLLQQAPRLYCILYGPVVRRVGYGYFFILHIVRFVLVHGAVQRSSNRCRLVLAWLNDHPLLLVNSLRAQRLLGLGDVTPPTTHHKTRHRDVEIKRLDHTSIGFAAKL
jgi:hypothetical protein